MPVVTIKSKARHSTEGVERMMREVRAQTARLLDAADRVLVVYDQGSANIYYEGAPLPLKTGQSPG